jgi:Putative zinc-finger
MTDHPSPATLRQFVRGELPPAETLAVDDHVSACAECAAALSPHLDAASRAAEEALFESHLTYEQLEAALSAPNEHVALCRRCREDLDELRAMQGRAHTWYWPAAAAAAIAGALFLFTTRDDAPRPVPRPAPPPLTATHPAPTPPPDPLAGLSAPLRATLEELAGGKVPNEDLLRALHPPRERVRSTTDESPSASLSPIGVVESARPRFQWDAVPGAAYAVSIANAKMDVVAKSKSLTSNSWRPPADLPRGEILTWQVTVERDGVRQILPAPPNPPARLRILSRDAAEAIANARNDALALAMLYAREGMIAEAENELRAYVRSHGEVEPAARALKTLEDARRRLNYGSK